MSDIVIRCPHKCHKKPVRRIVDGEEVATTPKPKILFIASSESIGTFKVQCTGSTPTSHGDCRGWYNISLNGLGGYKLTQLPRQFFELEDVPFVLED